MQFLKTLFWALLIGLAGAFTYGNWTSVQIRLWGGLVAEVNLPLLLIVTFLIGFVPMLVAYHAVRWRLRQRLASTERTLNELRKAQAASEASGKAAAISIPIDDEAPVPPLDTPTPPRAMS